MRVAAIDCGTNSVRLLIADAEDGRLRDVVREMRIVRLGQGVDATGRLAPEAIERTRRALVEYAALIREHRAERTRMTATSATRDAENRAEFVELVHDILGVEPEVITGDEEARLSFAGALSGLPDVHGDVIVADIGGGSTELVRGSSDGVVGAYSMDVGSVRLTERHVDTDPPTPAAADAIAADVRNALAVARRHVDVTHPATFVGVAGTITTLAAIELGLTEYDPAAVHGSTLTPAQVDEVTARLLSLDHDARAAIPALHPGRVDVITAGAVVLRTLVRELPVDSVTVSEHDILDGIALSLVAG